MDRLRLKHFHVSVAQTSESIGKKENTVSHSRKLRTRRDGANHKHHLCNYACMQFNPTHTVIDYI